MAILNLGGRRYIQSPFGEVNWVRNLRAAGEAVVSKGRSREEVSAIELTPDEAGPVLRDALSPVLKIPFVGAVLRRYFAVRADATLQDYISEAARHPTFELRTKV